MTRLPKPIKMPKSWTKAVQEFIIEHKNGGESKVTFKDYEGDTSEFKGSTTHMVWYDDLGEDDD